MKILVVSDIHANRAALDAIREECDLCVCLGDLVDYGVEPGPCIEWVRTNCRYAVRGNHDHSTAQRVTVQGSNGFRWLTSVTRPITLRRTTSDQRRFLAELPITLRIRIGGRRFVFLHGSPTDPLEGYNQPTAEFWEPRLQGLNADVVCVGHTHQQYQMRIGETLIVNPGSVGLPRDGDPRAGYAVIDGDEVILRRVEYATDETITAIDATPLPDSAKMMMRTLLQTGTLLHADAVPTRPPTEMQAING